MYHPFFWPHFTDHFTDFFEFVIIYRNELPSKQLPAWPWAPQPRCVIPGDGGGTIEINYPHVYWLKHIGKWIGKRYSFISIHPSINHILWPYCVLKYRYECKLSGSNEHTDSVCISVCFIVFSWHMLTSIYCLDAISSLNIIKLHGAQLYIVCNMCNSCVFVD